MLGVSTLTYFTPAFGSSNITGPPQGFVDAREHTALNRFTVTFDSPNYVYLDQVTVEVTGGVAIVSSLTGP